MEGLRRFVVDRSPRVPFTSRRYFREPEDHDLEEFYRFFHYHLISYHCEWFDYLSSSSNLRMGIIAAASAAVLTAVFLTFRDTELARRLLLLSPLAAVVLVYVVSSLKIRGDNRRLLERLGRLDDRLADLLGRDPVERRIARLD